MSLKGKNICGVILKTRVLVMGVVRLSSELIISLERTEKIKRI